MAWVAVAIGGAAVLGAGAAVYSANRAAGAIGDAANTAANTQDMVYNDQTRRWEPYEAVGKAALPLLSDWDKNNPLPDYQKTVTDPMAAWNYEQTPAYKAKFTLGSEELNNQLQARGLSTGAVAANRAADLSRKLTASDYVTERNYNLGNLQDIYKSKLEKNTTNYARLLDQVRIGQGANSSLGAAGQAYATGVGNAAIEVGKADAGFYAGLPGAVLGTANTGLKAYDTGRRAGWWGDSPSGTEVDNAAWENMPAGAWG